MIKRVLVYLALLALCVIVSGSLVPATGLPGPVQCVVDVAFGVALGAAGGVILGAWKQRIR